MNPQEQENQLTIRDKLLRDTFTITETLLTGLIIASSVAVLYPGQPRSPWLLGLFLIIGVLTPVLLKVHEIAHPFFIEKLWIRFFLLAAPFWVILLQFFVGLLQSPVETLLIEETHYRRLEPIYHFLPTSMEPQSSWLPLLSFGSMYLFCLTLFIIPKSLAYFERVLPWLCLISTLAGIFGFMQKIGGDLSPFYARDHSNTDYFSIFAYDGHWAAYALLWMTTCFCFAIRHLQYEQDLPISKTMAPWYLTGAFLLGYSGLFIEARLPSSLLLLYFSFLTLFFTVAYLRHPVASSQRYSFCLVAYILVILAVGVALQRLLHPQAIDLTAVGLRKSALTMFMENPLFGWGMDAYSQIGKFYQSDLLLGDSQERAFSDVFHMLAEFGIIGLLPITVVFIWLLVHYLRGSTSFLLSKLLLLACFEVGLLAFVDSPFMSPAVFLSFLMLFFSALRWTDLSRKRVDEVDAGSIVVTSSNLRRVPVYTGPKNEKFK